MAFCMKCGKEMPDSANFCAECGTQKDRTSESTVNSVQPTTTKTKRQLRLGTIIAIVASIALVLVAIVGVVIWAAVDAYYDNKYEQQFNNSFSIDDTDDVETDPITIMNGYAGDIVEDITEYEGYMPYSTRESCAVITDANVDDIYELYVVYNQKIDGVVHTKAEVWSLEPNNKQQIYSDTLYTEVGGNTGSMGIYVNSGQIYLGVIKGRPDGKGLNDTSTFTPLEQLGGLKPDTEEFTSSTDYTSSKSSVCKINGKTVNQTEYNEQYEKYYQIFSIPDNPDDSPMVMTVENFLTFFGD